MNSRSCHGNYFLGMKNEETRARWRRQVLIALAVDRWAKAATPLSDAEVMDRLNARFPRGVPQGEFSEEIIAMARQISSPLLHTVGEKRRCACGDGAHDGNRKPESDSPIIRRIEEVIRDSGFPIHES
jgi:hypothetical protein